MSLPGLAGILAGSVSRDITPDAVNWGNLSGASENSNQTISGITEAIDLYAQGNTDGLFFYVKNGGGHTTITSDTMAINVANGDTLHFGMDFAPSGTITLTIKNHTGGDVTLDTFTATP